MALPKLRFDGETAEITMMELRSNPGDVFDRVSRGLTVRVTKSGKWIATIKAPALAARDDDVIVVHRDGTTEDGRKPVTFRENLGGEYGEAFHDLAYTNPKLYSQFI